MPVGAPSLSEAVRMGAEIFHTLKGALKDAGHNTNVGDEGAASRPTCAAPTKRSASWPRSGRGRRLCSRRPGGVRPGPGRERIPSGGRYQLSGEGRTLDAAGMVRFYEDLCALPDPLDRGRHGRGQLGWLARAHRGAGQSVQLVGDDLFVTNPKIIAEGIERGVANAVLVKVNQIGSLSETLDAVELAHRAAYRCVLSHRPARPRTPPSPISPWPPTAGRSRPVHVALGPSGQVQPAAEDRGGARAGRAASRRARAGAERPMLTRVTDRLHGLEARHWLVVLAYGLAASSSAIMRWSAVAGCSRRRQLNQEIEATERQLAAVRAEVRSLKTKSSGCARLVGSRPDRRAGATPSEPCRAARVIILREEGGSK